MRLSVTTQAQTFAVRFIRQRATLFDRLAVVHHNRHHRPPSLSLAHLAQRVLRQVPPPKPPPLHAQIERVRFFRCTRSPVLGAIRRTRLRVVLAWECGAILHHSSPASTQPTANPILDMSDNQIIALVAFMVRPSLPNMLVAPVRALALKPLLKDLEKHLAFYKHYEKPEGYPVDL